jgi:hypothetical protein
MVAKGRETKNPAARGNRPDSHAATPMTRADRTTLMAIPMSVSLTTYPLNGPARDMDRIAHWGRSRGIVSALYPPYRSDRASLLAPWCMVGDGVRRGARAPAAILAIMVVTSVARDAALRPRVSLQRHGEMRHLLVQARHVRHTGAVVWRITSQGRGGQAMLPGERYITVEGPRG